MMKVRLQVQANAAMAGNGIRCIPILPFNNQRSINQLINQSIRWIAVGHQHTYSGSISGLQKVQLATQRFSCTSFIEVFLALRYGRVKVFEAYFVVYLLPCYV
jgi:hypothetical protein